MTGRTNIIPTKTPAITTEEFDINNVKWNIVRLQTISDCKQLLYAAGKYIALFTDSVSVSEDGATWNTVKLEDTVYCIFYNENSFFIGGYKVILITNDFVTFEKVENLSGMVYDIYYMNGNYHVNIVESVTSSDVKNLVHYKGTDVNSLVKGESFASSVRGFDITCKVYDNMSYVLWTNGSTTSKSVYLYISINGEKYEEASRWSSANNINLYNYLSMEQGYFYLIQDSRLYKSLSARTWTMVSQISTLKMIVNIEEQLLFFGDDNKVIVVKSGESIAEKTTSDYITLIDDIVVQRVLYDGEKLFMACQGGLMLYTAHKSSDGEVESVKTMSARKALEDSKKYTDKMIKELKEYFEQQLTGV